jgi:hypothetical protein
MTCPNCGLMLHGAQGQCPRCHAMLGYDIPTSAWADNRYLTGQPVYQLRGLSIATMALLAIAGIATAAVSVFPADSLVGGGTNVLIAFSGSALLVLAITIAAFVVEIIWLYRARKNVDAFVGAAPQWAVGWTIGAWFIPLANMVLPALVMADVARNSMREPRLRQTLGMVWALIATNIISGCGSAIMTASERSSDDLSVGAGDWFIAIIDLVNAALEIAVVYLITQAQTARIAAGIAQPQPALPGYAPYGAHPTEPYGSPATAYGSPTAADINPAALAEPRPAVPPTPPPTTWAG